MLEIKDLTCGYKKRKLLSDISFRAKPGDIVCILGPNGSGKSTLIKTLVGLIPALGGEVLLNNTNILDWSWKQRSKLISYIPQSFSSMFQYRVMDIVLMARLSHIGLSIGPSDKDIKIAKESMEKLNILHLENRIYSQISGGEKQLVKIAQALTQQARIIIMDEPTSNLDFKNQSTILEHLKTCADSGITVLMATHFLDQVLSHGTKVLLVDRGNVIEVDQPNRNLTERQLEDLYNININLVKIDTEFGERKLCLKYI